MSNVKKSHFEEITNLFVKSLSEGRIPWKQQWQFKTSSIESFVDLPFHHYNLKSGKAYRSINVLILEMEKNEKQYEHSFWLTFKQGQALNLEVIKGQKATRVYYNDRMYFKIVDKKSIKITLEEYNELLISKEYKVYKAPFLKKYSVFNIDQFKGEKNLPELTREIETSNTCLSEPDSLLANYTERPELAHGKPAYWPSMDSITMPHIDEFNTPNNYYSVYFHEIVHSTGHGTRLKREGITKHSSFGSALYAKEELIAEIGACFLSAKTNVHQELPDNNKAYIQSWIKSLKNDPQLIFWASAQAQTAYDFILEKSQVETTNHFVKSCLI